MVKRWDFGCCEWMPLLCFSEVVLLFMTVLSVQCVVDTWSADQLSRDNRRCHDWCSIMSHMCANNGTCVMDHVTCQGICRCSEGWSGKWCKDPVPMETFTDQAKEFDDIPPENLNAGEQNQSAVSSTNPEIFNNREFPEDVQVQAQLHSLSPSLFPKTMSPTSAVASTTVNMKLPVKTDSLISERESCQQTCHAGDCIRVNGLYKCRIRINATESNTLRICSPGFECEYGVCDMEALEKRFFKCLCESNYVGQFCSNKCPFDCGTHGFCDYDVGDRTYKCFCSWNYTGLNCSELVPLDEDALWIGQEITFHWYVVGISIAIVVCLIISVALTTYWMWKRRLVFILKIVHYFQQCEDDDGKEYDAFISYKSCPQDETFVLQKLYPKLEEEFNFKLCLHFRDFVPGEAIANNIVRAIESSRRTIIILSPSYVISEWCRMEYQTAQHEMLKLKHKIIPIVLEDISAEKNMDKNLKSILSSVTYLEWPGDDISKKTDRFWQKLQLSLPKKSVNSSTPSSSSYSSTSSSSTNNSSLSVTLPPSTVISSSPSSEPLADIDSYSPSASSDCESDTTVSGSLTLSREVIMSMDLDNSIPGVLTQSESPASSIEMRRSRQGKGKEFRHFMDKLVKNRLFKRQDSSSSQAALVDEETVASRSSCDSISEGFATESSESACSTPVTTHSYLSDMLCSETSKEASSKECEKDCCECSTCESCFDISEMCMQDSDYLDNAEAFVNKAFEDNEIGKRLDIQESCIQCQQILKSSDNNRVRISAIDDDVLRIQRLPCNVAICHHCKRVPSNFSKFRTGSKEYKDAANRTIHTLRRSGSLPPQKSIPDRILDNNTREINKVSRLRNHLPCDVMDHSVCIDICENV